MGKSSSKKIKREFKDLRKNLLDLTLRNQLLNFKDRNQTLSIPYQSPKNVYKTLVLQNKKMNFVPKGKDKEKSSKWSLHKPEIFSDDKSLEVNLTPNELQKKLFYINNQSKTMLQEQGYNILYIAIGFLRWFDKHKPKKANLAPLILIPVAMERKQAGNSFVIRWTGEDIQTNISLKTKLGEEGIEIPDFQAKNYVEAPEQYMNEISKAVKFKSNWKVTNKVALGFFSFTKFIMYNDLNPESWGDDVDLTNHPLIQAIFDPSVNDSERFDENDVDKINYKDMYQVLDADSSQIAVIEDVKAGRNLVVEGPPGTGKSQTIVNLIAELIADGKTVLFVSEKMAALEVVKDRLTSVGLGKYLLELHSHKTRRKKFIKELKKSATVRSTTDKNIDRTIRKLETLKKQLDDYAEIIHKPLYSIGLSAYDLYGRKEFAEEYFQTKGKILPLVRFENPESITLKDLDDIILALENLAELHQTINDDNPWSYCSPDSLLPSDLREIQILISDSSSALDNFNIEAEIAEEKFGIKKAKNLRSLDKTIQSLDFLDEEVPVVDKDILNSAAWDEPKIALKLIDDLDRYQKSAKILDKFNPEILDVNIDYLISEIEENSHKKFRFFSKNNSKVVEEYYLTKVPNDSTVISDLNRIKEFKKIKEDIDKEEQLGKSYFSDLWSLNTSTDDLRKIYNWIFKLKQYMNEDIFTDKVFDYITNDFKTLPIKESLKDYIKQAENFRNQLNKLQTTLKPNTRLIFKKDPEDVEFSQWVNQFNKWNGHFSSLHLWSQYLNTKNACMNSEAKLFIETIEKRNIKKDDVNALVSGNFADSLLNKVFVDSPELSSFVGELHENRIKEFQDLDREILKLNRRRVFNKLNKNIPKIYGGASNPEAKILAGEFTRKSGHLPVRTLLEKTGDLIKQIKPVFMMSPLSIAQYLDPTNPKLQFDVVIFDEASQVKPEDALGAFMRGKTAVVMGDTQQLPPTSFFDQIAEGESHEEVATANDMESILHLCKLSFPVRMLKWHYRSRHESLIAVSNREFYDNQLLVYPSPSHDDPDLGLKFKYCPDTIYERGEGSYNRGEAKEVVKEIFRHFEKYGDSKSLGVGTFSVAQRNAILEELEIERKKHPELEPLFSENRPNRFFVKNLETIQGDERDVILISVGYGFDQNRKMSLNFGPLNQDGGERRLNVLVTRAKEKCVVFSNFRAHDIHLTANPPFGVRALKEFLEYAENLTMGNIPADNATVEPFEEAIYTFLVDNGFTVDKHVGCAGFRVDLAVVDENNPGRYILGITTDGKMYASSKVARDRDRLRQQVLEGLGWKLYHVWSTDWYRNCEVSKEHLLNRVQQAKIDIVEDDKKRAEEERKFQEKMEEEKQRRLEEAQKTEEEKNQSDEEATDDFVEVVESDDEDFINPLNKNTSESGNGSINPENMSTAEDRISEIYTSNDLNIDSSVNDNSKDIHDEKRSKELINQFSNNKNIENINNTGDDLKDTDNKVYYGDLDSLNNTGDGDFDKNLTEVSEIDEDDADDVDGVLEEPLIIDNDLISELKEESDRELLSDIHFRQGSNQNSDNHSFVDKSLNKLNEKFSDDEVSARKSVDNIGSFIGSKISNIKGNNEESSEISTLKTENNDKIIKSSDGNNFTDDDNLNISGTEDSSDENSFNSKNNHGNTLNKSDTYELNESDIDDLSDRSDLLGSELNESDSDESESNSSELNESKKMLNNNDKSNEKVLYSDDEYEYVEVPINQKLKDGEEIITSNQLKDIEEGEKNSKKNKVKFMKTFKSGDSTEDLDGLIDTIVNTGNESSENSEMEASSTEINNNHKSNNNDNLLGNGENNSKSDTSSEHDDKYSNQADDFSDYESNTYDDFYADTSFNNPLSKNYVEHDIEDKKDESIIEKFSKFKKELEYINESLKEIENGGKPSKVHVIDRTNDELYDKNPYNIGETVDGPGYDSYDSDSDDINSNCSDGDISNQYSNEYITEDTVIDSDYINNPSDTYNSSKNDSSLNNKIIYSSSSFDDGSAEVYEGTSSFDDGLNSIDDSSLSVRVNNSDNHNQEDDDILENVIENANKDYEKIEEKRKEESNSLKTIDDRTLPIKGKSMKNYIKPYVEYTNIPLKTQDDVYDKPVEDITEVIKDIVDVEGPIHKDIIIKRIKESSGIKRAGSKLKSVVNNAIKLGEDKGSMYTLDDFVYSNKSSEINVRKRNKPNINYISNDEIGANIKLVLIFKEHLTDKKLIRTVARNFGFKSTSKKTSTRINSVIDLMLAKGILEIVKGEIQIK